MTIYVVIPVHNRVELTRGCLASLQQQDVFSEKPGDSVPAKVIAVDDGSTDGTSEMIREQFPDTVLLQGDGSLWWVGSINMGIRHALAVCRPDDLILSLNDDLVVGPDYLSSLITAARLHPGAIIGSVETLSTAPDTIKNGGILINWKTAKRRVLNRGRQLNDFPKGHMVEVSRLTGRGTLFPSRVFRDVGLYDEAHFRQCGDPELPVRARFKAGYRLLVSYDSVVISYPGDPKSINDRKAYRLSDWREYFFGIRSHFNLGDHYWFARKVAPNWFWFLRFFLFDVVRTTGHFVIRLRLRRTFSGLASSEEMSR